MSRFRRPFLASAAPVAAAALVVAAVLLVAAPGAAADPSADAVSQLRSARVYIDPAATANGVHAVLAAASAAVPNDARVAVLANTAGRDITLANSIEQQLGTQLGTPLTVGVILVTPTGTISFRAASSKFCAGFADEQAARAAAEHAADLQNGSDLTATIVDFAHRLSRGPVDDGQCPVAADGSGSGGWAVWLWIAGIAVVLTVAAASALYLRAGRRTRGVSDAGRTEGNGARATDGNGARAIDGGGGTEITVGDPAFGGGILTGTGDDDDPGGAG